MKPALLVIDIQKEYLEDIPEMSQNIAFRHINWAIWLFRKNNFPVIRVYHHEKEYGPQPGDPKFEFPETVGVKESDPKIVKNFPSSFKKTDLEKFLREQGCDAVYLCGLSAVYCVLATYFGAEDRDIPVFFVKHALLSHDLSYTRMIEDVYDAVGCSTVQYMFENLKK